MTDENIIELKKDNTICTIAILFTMLVLFILILIKMFSISEENEKHATKILNNQEKIIKLLKDNHGTK